jgi:hypothetical protein
MTEQGLPKNNIHFDEVQELKRWILAGRKGFRNNGNQQKSKKKKSR